jgi:predicted transcriptional regulator
METGIFTVRMDLEKQKELDALAKRLDLSRDHIIDQALADFLETHAWGARQIEKGLSEARRGEFASDEEIEAIFSRYAPSASTDR